MYRELVNRIRGGKIIDISRSCDLVCIKIETIDNILNKGVTVWHGHGYLGNYLVGDADLDNPII